MESKIANAISLNYQPVALIWSDREPAQAVQFQEGKWVCIMWLAASAAKGKAAACDRKTFGCFGGVVGMGFGDQYVNFPGGKDCFCHHNVIIPYAAGCQTIGIYPYQEAKAEKQRAVVGLTDLSARVSIRKLLDDHLMTFAVPLAMFEEMERNVADSFLERPTWQALLKT
jgi:hypothetical protein